MWPWLQVCLIAFVVTPFGMAILLSGIYLWAVSAGFVFKCLRAAARYLWGRRS